MPLIGINNIFDINVIGYIHSKIFVDHDSNDAYYLCTFIERIMLLYSHLFSMMPMGFVIILY